MEITKQEAAERLVDYCDNEYVASLSLGDAILILDFLTMEDGVNGIGLLPPLTKQGKYEWAMPSTISIDLKNSSQDLNSSEGK